MFASSQVGMKYSPLDSVHRQLGAKMAEFGGWEMPISYERGTIHEHETCRSTAVVFDVSHLGTLRVTGSSAFDALQYAFTNDLRRIGPGRAQYTHLLDPEDASVIDDIIVWWHPKNAQDVGYVFDVMPNASNTDRVIAALRAFEQVHGHLDLLVEGTTTTRAVLAVQGPLARARTAQLIPEVVLLPKFAVREVLVEGSACVLATTGYTGEDGFELAIPSTDAHRIWQGIVACGVEPAGLGARDTLRLEAGLPLHGHELGPGITPWQANLGWVARVDKAEFVGRTALLAERERGVGRTLVGLRLAGRQPAREGSEVHVSGSLIGHVTSGNYSPTLGCAIAFALLDADTATVGDPVVCSVRGKDLPATVVKVPFLPQKST